MAAPGADGNAQQQWARYALLALSAIFLAGALGQFFLAGLSVFDPADGPDHWSNHANMGHALGLLTYVLWIPAVVGRVGRKMITASLLLLVLFGLQFAFAESSEPYVQALHPLNGAIIFATTAWLTVRTFNLIRTPSQPPSSVAGAS